MTQKRKYESPRTVLTQVELERGFMAGSSVVRNPDQDNGRIEEHQVNNDFGYTLDGDNNTWTTKE